MNNRDERKRIAQEIRDLPSIVSEIRDIYKGYGLYVGCDDHADYYQIHKVIMNCLPAEHMHPCDYKEFHDALADLIDPKGIESDAFKPVESDGIDRDTLLALADEMDAYTRCPDDDRCGIQMPPFTVHNFARRIRAALGHETKGE